MYTGPNLAKQENLVFGFDTGDGVADPGLSTRFYKGKPTTNIASGAASIHDTASGSAGSCVDAPEKGPGWKKVTITAIGTNFRVIQFGSYPSLTANITYSSSFEVDWGNMRGKGYTLTQDGSGGGTRNYFKNGSYATGSTGVVSIDSTLLNGHIGMNIVKTANHVHVPFIYNTGSTSTTGRNDYFYYKEYQQEAGTIPTPYVNGTRSDTASLIDLTKKVNIDMDTVSYDDETGQPEYDGTDDFLTIAHHASQNFAGDFTIEVVFKPTAQGNANCLMSKGSGNDNFQNYWLLVDVRTSGLRQANFIMGNSTNNGAVATTTANDVITIGAYHHIVATVSGTTSSVYVNGVLKQTGTIPNRSQETSDIKIGRRIDGFADSLGVQPIAKLYDLALTAEEVKSNFNVYRNRFNI